MLSVKQLKEIDPELAYLSDEEVIKLRDDLYAFIEPILDEYLQKS